MKQSALLITRGSTDSRIIWLAGLIVTGSCYFAIFSVSSNRPPLEDFKAAALNCLSLAMTALVARAILRRWVLPLRGRTLWALHLTMAVAFSVAWSWLLYLVTGISVSGSATRFNVIPFLQGPAQQWQLMQGVFAYAAIAALTVLEHRPAGALLILDNSMLDLRERFLLKADGDVVSLAASDIVSISGADDYAEIVTLNATHLVSTTLSDLQGALDPQRFVRVHRSAIANLDHVQRAEPVGGGRMTLSMKVGPDLAVSRAGARLLRERSL